MNLVGSISRTNTELEEVVDPISKLISSLFWYLIVSAINLRFERQFITRLAHQHDEISRVIGDFSSLTEYVGRHRLQVDAA